MGRIVFGRNFILALPILALSACSVIEQPFLQSQNDVSYGQYDQGCSAGTCAPGQSYSVAGGTNSNHWPDQQLVSGYEHGGNGYAGQNQGAYGQGPTHVNPNGHGPQGQQYGYNQPPHLRGLRGQKRGNFYGTLGGVMYDTDLDSFGVQGRAGWNSGRGIWGAEYGAEVEGSIGLTDEKVGTVGSFTDVTSGFDNNFGAYMVSRLPLSQRFSLHSRVGYNSHKVTTEGTDINGNKVQNKITVDGLSIGFGAEYAVSPKTGLRFDYTESDTNLGGALKGFSASVVKKF